MDTGKYRLMEGDVVDRMRELPSESAHCCVTSPPYWGLRDYGVPGQLGCEKVLDCLGWATGEKCGECHVCKMVRVFAEVWRVLRKDATLWLNYGDCYFGGGGYYPDAPSNQNSLQSRGNAKGERNIKGQRNATKGECVFRLRSDLTDEQKAYVLSELAKARQISEDIHEGRE